MSEPATLPSLPSGPHDGEIDAAIAAHADRPGQLLQILHGIHDRLGFIPSDAIPRVARALNLSRAEVHGVVTFYHDFRTAPPGRHVIKLCRAEACQSMGSDTLAAHLQAHFGMEFGATTPDGAVTLEAVYCLGSCACSPALTIDGKLRGRMNRERLDQLVASLKDTK